MTGVSAELDQDSEYLKEPAAVSAHSHARAAVGSFFVRAKRGESVLRISNSKSANRAIPNASPPSEAALYAQLIQGQPIAPIVNPERRAHAAREELERLARFSRRHAEQLRKLETAEAKAQHDREILEWAARISTRAADELRALERKEADERDAWRRAEQFYERYCSALNEWSEADHLRKPAGTPEGGQFASKGGGGISAGAGGTKLLGAGSAGAHLTAFGDAPSTTWPTTGPTSGSLPKVGGNVAAGAGTAAGIGAGGFLWGLRNASMGKYWGHVPAKDAMPQIWVYELEKRVRAGTLSREDAKGIFNTAVLGAEAQSFAPTGNTMSAVHNSAKDFLGEAEQVYFARKKQNEESAKQSGGYQRSGGRVFPTEHNSGLKGAELSREQEDFFRRGLAEGKEDWYLRGQASNAGLKRHGMPGKDDHLEDAEAEAALQRAMKRAKE